MRALHNTCAADVHANDSCPLLASFCGDRTLVHESVEQHLEPFLEMHMCGELMTRSEIDELSIELAVAMHFSHYSELRICAHSICLDCWDGGNAFCRAVSRRRT